MVAAFSFLFGLLYIVADWQIYKKMGLNGWNCLVPIYSTFVVFKKLYGNGWKFLFLLIPIFNIYVAIKYVVDIAKGFGQSGWFAVGLICLPTIFEIILGLSNEKRWVRDEVEYQSDFVDTLFGIKY